MSSPAPQDPPATPSRRWPLLAGIGLALLTVWYVFLVTDTTFRFDVPEWYRGLYPSMWRSLLQGRFDLDRGDLPGEAFLRDGKAYTYYGFVPALLRGVLSPVIPLDWTGMPELMEVIAALVVFVSFATAALLLKVHRTRPALFVAYLVTVGLATPVVNGLSRAHVFNEAGMWGAAWGSAFVAALVVFCATPVDYPRRGRAFVLMALFAAAALHSRLTVGACALLVLAAVGAWSSMGARRLSRRSLLLAAGIVGAACVAQAAVNQGRWGSALTFRPIQLHESFLNTERGQREAINGAHRLDRVPTGLRYYFVPALHYLRPTWPFLKLGMEAKPSGDATLLPDAAPFDHTEFGMPLLWSTPALVLFALLGLLRLRSRQAWEARAALLLAGVTVLLVAFFVSFDTLVIRYLMDFVPFLAGLGLLALLGPGVKRPAALGAMLAPLIAFSVFGTYVTTALLKVYGPCANAAEIHAAGIRRMLGR